MKNCVLNILETFYDELSIVKISETFKEYARSYKIETKDSKNLLVELEASKLSIKDFKMKLKTLNIK